MNQMTNKRYALNFEFFKFSVSVASAVVCGAAIRLQAPDEAGRNFLSVHPRAPLIGLCM